jgi:hypothetical protein
VTLELEQAEVLLLWRLILMDEQPTLTNAKPKISVPRRKHLIDAGLIETDKRGRATHLLATEMAWDWAAEHLDAPFSASPAAAEPLHALLTRLKSFLAANRLALADVIRARPVEASTPPPKPEPPTAKPQPVTNQTVEQRIRAIYQEETASSLSGRLRLSRLRNRLSEVPRDAVDRALLEMQRSGALVLYPLDDPREISDDDRRAAIDLLGNPRHILYMEA